MFKTKKFGRAALCALGLSLGAQAAQAQTSLPAAELGGLSYNNNGGRILVAQSNDAQSMVRIQQLEEQIRTLNGQIEGLTFQLTQLQEMLNRFQEDAEFRFQQLEGGDSGNSEAATRSGSVMQPQALPQDPATNEEAAPLTDIPEQGVKPLPGEQEFDPTFGDEGAVDELGNSADPLVGTGQNGGINLATGQPLDLSYNPTAKTGNADADAQFAAARQALETGDYEFAEDQFKQFLELYPDNPNLADASSGLGKAMIARGGYTEAADVLVTAYEKHQSSPVAPELLMNLGVALAGVGERETACRTFGEVRSRYPNTGQTFQTSLLQANSQAQCPPV